LITYPLTYLASPYTHPDPAVRAARFDAACRAAAKLMRAGALVFSPIAHSHPIALAGELPIDWAFWERYCRAMLAACADVAVLKLDGWDASAGIAAELDIARETGKPIAFLEPRWSE
jgi:nucleoside 2-deoxyribosyltransferase